mgnify:CR=1 FL=1
MKFNKRFLIYILIVTSIILATIIANLIAAKTERGNGLRFMTLSIFTINIIVAFIFLRKHFMINIFFGIIVAIIGAIFTPKLANPPLNYHDNNIYIAIKMIISKSLILIVLWEILFIINRRLRKV